jgi:tetratricopeptide (TPR) repeat protein
VLGKNKVQKNFKKEMKAIEKEILKKSQNNSGEPSNSFFNNDFYYQRDRSFGNKIKKFFNFLFSYGVIIFIAIFIIYCIFVSLTDYTDKIYSSFENENYEDTIKYSEKVLKNNSSHYDALAYKGVSHRLLGDFQKSLEVFQIANELYPNDTYILNELAYCNYSLGYYYMALEYYNQVIKIDSSNIEALYWKGYTLLELAEYDKAIESTDALLKLGYKDAEVYNLKGLVFLNQNKYTAAIESFDKAIKSDYEEYETYENAHLNKIYALFSQNDLQGCIEFCESIQKEFPNNSDIPYYIGDCYSFMGEYREAIKYYKEAREMDPENSWLVAEIAKQYFYLQEYTASKTYALEAINIDSENFIAQDLLNKLEEIQLPEAERIVNFVKENYLYLDKVEDFDIKAENFISKDEIEYQDIYEFIESIRIEDDLFTFFIWGEYYEEYIDEIENDDIEYKVLDENYHYLRFDSFTQGISGKFSHTLKNIPATENSYLILDLRDNPGGLLFTAINILDTLLPECISSYTIDRNGYMNTFKTSYDHFPFKHIYLLVNEDSASASELVALSLKTYLPNVTIVGKNTFGKGVGQTVFENKENKYIIFLTDSFWNVKETNILEIGVQPDIIVNGTKFEDFLQPVIVN